MSQKAFLIIINIPVISAVFLLGFFLPELSKRDLLFGVKLSIKQRSGKEIKNVIKAYRNHYIIICGIYTSLLILIFSLLGKYYILLPGLIILIILMEIVYSKFHKILLNIDSLKSINAADGNYIIIENKKHSMICNNYWLLIPFSIALFSLLIGLAAYENMPVIVPSYLLIGGKPGIWVHKSPITIYVSIFIQLAAISASYFISRYISHIKLNLGTINAEKYNKILKLYIKIWSSANIEVCSIFSCTFMVIVFNSVLILNKQAAYWIIILLLLAIFIILLRAYKTTGKDGINLELNLQKYIKLDKPSSESAVINRNDEAYWKFGNFYFNPKDPNMWIKRTSGTGYDFNYGKPASWIILSIAMALFIFIMWILIVHSK